MSKNDTLGLRVELEGDSAKEFEAIKRARGLKQNTEVIRLIIREIYHSLDLNGTEDQKIEVAHTS
jgi:hypothetical protein